MSSPVLAKKVFGDSSLEAELPTLLSTTLALIRSQTTSLSTLLPTYPIDTRIAIDHLRIEVYFVSFFHFFHLSMEVLFRLIEE